MARVEVFSKSWCPYCHRAKALLEHKGQEFDEIDVEEEAARVSEMVERSGGLRSVPQIFIDDVHVGGFDDLAALERAGRLDALLVPAEQ
jgi:glutaredoxin 3